MKDNLSEIVLVLDKSSSMLATAKDTLDGVNAFIKEQKELPGEANFTLATFSDHDKYKKLYESTKLSEVKDITLEEYSPYGNTALLDAIGRTIDEVGKKLAELPEDERPANVIFTIMTDGKENDSRVFGTTQIHDKISHQRDTYNWKFIFLGAGEDAISVGHGLGMTNSFQYNTRLYASAFSGTSVVAKAYRSGASFTQEDEALLQTKILNKNN